MTDPKILPHDDYTTHVIEALSYASLTPAEYWTSDGETRGTYCYLNAVITLDPSHTHDLDDDDIPDGTAWRHGLALIWEWHTGIEADEPERGPQWLFAELKDDGSNEDPTGLPVEGYANPAAVVEAARKVISREIGAGHFHNFGLPKWDGGVIGGSWDRADELDAVCEAWGVDERSE